MKRPNITSGPWLHIGHTVFALTPYTGADARMKKRLPDGINRFSCRVQQDNSEASGGASMQEIKANVQAIAALPDLLVALEAIESTLAGHPESGTGNTKVHCAMHAARTALTKAGYTF
jgi:hypothetical protein